jgi:hypothetical protein
MMPPPDFRAELKMKFFVPFAKDPREADATYKSIVAFNTAQMGPLRNQRYYAIFYKHDGNELRARVGDPHPLTGEPVIAILRTERQNGPFLICTENRGVVRGEPILGAGNARAIHFEG